MKAVGESEVIIVIAFARVNKYEGELYLANYPATRFYLNPKHYCVKEFQERCLPLMKLKNLTENYIEKDVQCAVKVKKVEEQYNWYENCCPGCGEEVNKVEGRFRCTECKRNIPWPDKRFRLTTVCSDASGILAIILPDDEIQSIIGKEVFGIENDESQVGIDGLTFPPLLKQFEKRDYIVTVSISALNVKKTSKVYKAKKLDNPLKNLGENEPAELKTAETVDHTMETKCRVHAFVPGNLAATFEPTLEIGELYLFKNFTIKDYKQDEKFRPVRKNWQIVFGSETKITKLDENEVAVDKAAFDFYDLADLKDLAF
ncbi:hypothetical protein ACET3Z_021252 [Daucus carota]